MKYFRCCSSKFQWENFLRNEHICCLQWSSAFNLIKSQNMLLAISSSSHLLFSNTLCQNLTFLQKNAAFINIAILWTQLKICLWFHWDLKIKL
jgi:hypothetical protein